MYVRACNHTCMHPRILIPGNYHCKGMVILMGKRELVTLLSLSSSCLVIVVWLLLMRPCVCLKFVIVAFPDHTHLLFLLYLLGVLVLHFVLNTYIVSFPVWQYSHWDKGSWMLCLLHSDFCAYPLYVRVPCLLVPCVCLGLRHFLVIDTCFNPKVVV